MTKQNKGVFPSGQWGQTVNLLLNASVVRIHPRPPKGPDLPSGRSGLFCLQKVRRAARRKPDLPCGRSGFCRGAAGIRRRNNLRSGASGPSGPHGRDSGGCSGRRPGRRKPCRPDWRSGPGPGCHRPGPDRNSGCIRFFYGPPVTGCADAPGPGGAAAWPTGRRRPPAPGCGAAGRHGPLHRDR